MSLDGPLSLLDQVMPRYDVRERHRVRVAARAELTYAAIRDTDLSRVRLVAALMWVRSLPARLGGRHDRSRPAAASTLESLERAGFRLLAESPPTELVLGIEGQFWRPAANVCSPPAEAFLASPLPAAGTARAAWSFTVTAAGARRSVLATETRVLCADADVRRRFLPYWYLIRPGSGLIRHALLRAIRRTAEAARR